MLGAIVNTSKQKRNRKIFLEGLELMVLLVKNELLLVISSPFPPFSVFSLTPHSALQYGVSYPCLLRQNQVLLTALEELQMRCASLKKENSLLVRGMQELNTLYPNVV